MLSPKNQGTKYPDRCLSFVYSECARLQKNYKAFDKPVGADGGPVCVQKASLGSAVFATPRPCSLGEPLRLSKVD